MNRIKRYLIIIGANARIARFLLKDLASEQIFEEIYLISSNKMSKAITANYKRTHIKFSNVKMLGMRDFIMIVMALNL